MADDRSQPKVQLVTVGEANDGQRLDNFLLGRLRGVPKSWVYRVLRRGEVRVNKGRCRPDRRLQLGDVVRIPPLRQSDPARPVVPPGALSDLESAVVYEDKDLLVLNKPAGIAVHGGSGLSFGVIEAMRKSRPNAPYLELVHRLDRETSGCLMLAKRRPALRALQAMQRAQDIDKHYLMLLPGDTKRRRWRTDLPLRKNTLQGGERIVRVSPDGKPAVTRFRVVERLRDCLLVEGRLETGRTHQIRVHAAAEGLPILGDDRYGDPEANRRWRRLGLKRLFLHASSLRFESPGSGQDLQIEAPLPEDLRRLVEALRDG